VLLPQNFVIKGAPVCLADHCFPDHSIEATRNSAHGELNLEASLQGIFLLSIEVELNTCLLPHTLYAPFDALFV
jgi:hypothetical protein